MAVTFKSLTREYWCDVLVLDWPVTIVILENLVTFWLHNIVVSFYSLTRKHWCNIIICRLARFFSQAVWLDIIVTFLSLAMVIDLKNIYYTWWCFHTGLSFSDQIIFKHRILKDFSQLILCKNSAKLQYGHTLPSWD